MKYNYSHTIVKLKVKLNVLEMELAKLLCVSFSSVNRWERGKYEPIIIVK